MRIVHLVLLVLAVRGTEIVAEAAGVEERYLAAPL